MHYKCKNIDGTQLVHVFGSWGLVAITHECRSTNDLNNEMHHCLYPRDKTSKKETNKEKRMRGKRGRRVRTGAAVRFPFWVGFPRRVNQRRVTTRSPEPFHLCPGVSSRIIGEVSQFPSDSHSCCHTAGHQLYDRNPPRLCKVHLIC